MNSRFYFRHHLISTLDMAFSKGAVVAAAGPFFFFLALVLEPGSTKGREEDGARPGMEEEAVEETEGASPGMYPLSLAFAILLPLDWYAATSS